MTIDFRAPSNRTVARGNQVSAESGGARWRGRTVTLNSAARAAKRAWITKRIGWYTLRHTFGTLLKANGEDVATVQALMRHANVSVTMNTYVQTVTPAKRKVQRGIIKQIREVAPDPNLKCLQVLEKMVGDTGFEPMTSSV